MPAQPNIEICRTENKKFRQIFILKEPLEFRRAIPFLAVNSHPNFTDPGEYIILLKDVPSEEKVIRIMSDIALAETIREILKADKEARKPDKKRAYRQKTRDPINRLVDREYEKLDDKDLLSLIIALLTSLYSFLTSISGKPVAVKRTRFDPIQIIALIILKFVCNKGYRKLPKIARKLEASKEVPCKSYLHKIATQKLNLAWLACLLVFLDDIAGYIWAEFFASEKVLYFFIDGTKVSRSQYDYSDNKAKKKTMCVTMSVRLVTGTVRTVEIGWPKNVAAHIATLPSGSIVLMDKHFDCEDNFEVAYRRRIEVHCPVPDYVRLGTMRRWAREIFSRAKYRLRKVGEKVFRFVFRQLEPLNWHESNDVAYSLLASIGNNVKRLIKISIRVKLFAKLVLGGDQ